MKKTLNIFIILILINSYLIATNNSAEKHVLKVAVKVVEPFIFKDGSEFYGYSIDILNRIKKDLNIEYEIIEKKSINTLLNSVKNSEVDLAIAAITINATRSSYIDFSQPYYRGGLQIAIKQKSSQNTILKTLKSIIFSKIFIYSVAIFLITIIIVAHIIWWEESKDNIQFSKRYKDGILDSIYWTIITVTTVGYGDKVAKSSIGKFTTLIWVIFGYFLFAYFTASVTTASTLANINSGINSLEDLENSVIGTIKGSSAEEFLQSHNMNIKSIDKPKNAYKSLQNESIQAFVYDAPILAFQLKNRSSLVTVGEIFKEEYYGIALPKNSKYRDNINISILKLKESSEYRRLYNKWFM